MSVLQEGHSSVAFEEPSPPNFSQGALLVTLGSSSLPPPPQDEEW